jgi:hypothetical protein
MLSYNGDREEVFYFKKFYLTLKVKIPFNIPPSPIFKDSCSVSEY